MASTANMTVSSSQESLTILQQLVKYQPPVAVSEVVDEQGQTPERRPHHLRILFLQMVGDVCLYFKGAEGLAAVEELNGANVREERVRF